MQMSLLGLRKYITNKQNNYWVLDGDVEVYATPSDQSIIIFVDGDTW